MSKLEKLLEKQQQLEARIQKEQSKISDRERKQRTRRLILLGAYLEKWMESDSEIRDKVLTHVQKEVTKKVDVMAFEGMLKDWKDARTSGQESAEGVESG